MSLYLDSVNIRQPIQESDSAKSAIQFSYCLFDKKVTIGVLDSLRNLSFTTNDTVLNSYNPIDLKSLALDIRIGTFLIDMLHPLPQGKIPEKAYLYLWIPSTRFAHYYWNKDKANKLPIDYTISNSQ